jgi:hypothetical protein
MERDYKEVEIILNRILNGENGPLLKELKCSCTAFCLSVRRRFGFQDIPIKAVIDELTDPAVDEAVAKARAGKPFLLLLQNSFRDECRKKRQQMREILAIRICDGREDGDGQTFGENIAVFNTPISAAIGQERKAAVRKALLNEEPISRIIVYRRFRGDTLVRIAEFRRIKKQYQEVKRIYYANMSDIERQLIRFKKDFEIQ